MQTADETFEKKKKKKTGKMTQDRKLGNFVTRSLEAEVLQQ